jgi:DNA end-binding protein Ku
MKSIWSGSISFGLVNIPIKLYTASERKNLSFDMLHKKDLSPIGYMRVCKADGTEVPYKEIVKGYEFRKGDYVVLTDEDFKRADVKKTNTIEIVDFVKEAEVPSEYFEKPYYLEPAKGAAKVYALLREALKKSKKVGVAKFVLKTQEHLAVLKPEGNLLILDQIRFQHEIREPSELNIPKDEKVTQKELDLALSLIDQLSAHFQPQKYKDTYTEELKEIINKKAKGQKIVTPKAGAPAATTQVSELMSKLRESPERTKRANYTQTVPN